MARKGARSGKKTTIRTTFTPTFTLKGGYGKKRSGGGKSRY